MKQPLVSIIIPVYNSEKFVEEAVLSAVNQTYKNIEIIVVNDGSTDGSQSIIEQLAAKYSSIRYFRQLNQGACVARNRGITEAKGKYIKFLDADDLLVSDALELQVEFTENLQPDEIVFGYCSVCDVNLTFIRNYRYEENFNEKTEILNICFSQAILTSLPLHRRELLVENGGFSIQLPYGQEEDLNIRLMLSGVRYIYYPHLIEKVRFHDSESRISNTRRTEFWERIRKIERTEQLFLKAGRLTDAERAELAEYTMKRAGDIFFTTKQKREFQYLVCIAKRISQKKIIPLLNYRSLYIVYLTLPQFILPFSVRVSIVKLLMRIIKRCKNGISR